MFILAFVSTGHFFLSNQRDFKNKVFRLNRENGPFLKKPLSDSTFYNAGGGGVEDFGRPLCPAGQQVTQTFLRFSPDPVTRHFVPWQVGQVHSALRPRFCRPRAARFSLAHWACLDVGSVVFMWLSW
jgi:hypothetical protein